MLVAIVNPVAGQGQAGSIWRRVEHRLREHGLRVTTCFTAGPGDAVRLTREAIAEGAETVLAVGGDGTVHEVINGFLRHGQIHDGCRLGIIPAGTGMDFARNLGAERGVDAAVRRILANRERRMDVGLARHGEEQLFVNFAETGLGARVVVDAARLRGKLPGRAAFLLATLHAAIKGANTALEVTVDGMAVYAGCATSVVVANGRYFGGGMKIAPEARTDDGLLDVVILGDFSRLELLTQLWMIYPGIHLRHPKVLWLQGRSVVLAPRIGARLDLDGELAGQASCTLSILPAALRVLA